MLTPPDKERCQADVPGNGPFTIGGKIGDPRNGYRVRCENKPTVIVTERKPGTDGLRGSMSLCANCLAALYEQHDADYVDVQPLSRRVLPAAGTPSRASSSRAAKNPPRVAKPGPSWRVEVTLSACRWAQNILVDVQGNHGGHLPAAARECIHTAIAALAEVPHAMEREKPT